MIADDGGGGLAALIGSASLKDTQSGWSNVALRLSGAVLPTLLASELAVAGFSGWRGRADAFTAPPAARGPQRPQRARPAARRRRLRPASPPCRC